MRKARLATVWLDGCSGCHMSLLDMDELILNVAKRADVVYGPLVDAQEFPKAVDVTVVEGAVSSQEDLEKVRLIRQRTGRPAPLPKSAEELYALGVACLNARNLVQAVDLMSLV